MNSIVFDHKVIETKDIHVSNQWSLHPISLQTSTELQNSFTATGIINTPLVLKKEKHYELVSGYKRLHFLLRNNISSVAVRILPNTIKTKQLLQILLTDQVLSAPLTIVEKAFFIKLACQYLTDDEVISNFAHQLPCKKHKSVIAEHLLLLETGKEILRLIHENIVSEQTALFLIKMEKSDQMALAQLISDLQPGVGKQRRIVTMLQDLSKRLNTSISKYLQRDEIKKILYHDSMNPPQKVQQLIEFLKSKHTPNLHEAEQTFKNAIRTLNLPSHAQISPSQSFEKNSVFLTLEFNNLSDLQEKWPKIDAILAEK